MQSSAYTRTRLVWGLGSLILEISITRGILLSAVPLCQAPGTAVHRAQDHRSSRHRFVCCTDTPASHNKPSTVSAAAGRGNRQQQAHKNKNHTTLSPSPKMGRGRGKGKRGGRGGGGRQHFVSSLEELESRNDRDEAWAARRKAEREEGESGESSSEEESGGKKKGGDYDEDEEGGGSSEGEDGAGAAEGAAAAAAMEQMKQPKAKGVSSLIEVANPNAKPKAGRMMKAKVGTGARQAERDGEGGQGGLVHGLALGCEK